MSTEQSKSPETDNHPSLGECCRSGEDRIDANFARTLEQQRDEARALVKTYRLVVDVDKLTLQQKLDEALAALKLCEPQIHGDCVEDEQHDEGFHSEACIALGKVLNGQSAQTPAASPLKD